MSRLVRVASSTAVPRLMVTVSNGLKVKFYYPKKASTNRLKRLLAEKTPCSVIIDTFGPSVFYEVPHD